MSVSSFNYCKASDERQIQQLSRFFLQRANWNDEKFINGIPALEWHSMSDVRRDMYMKEKRKDEAFKTSMCKGFIHTGFCRYGEQCRFAHREDELRIRPVHPKYKTELCRNYAMQGLCVYGPRCQFVHQSPPSRSRPLHCTGLDSVSDDRHFDRFVGASQLNLQPIKESEAVQSDVLRLQLWDPFSSKNLFADSRGSLTSTYDGKNFSRSCFPIGIFNKQ